MKESYRETLRIRLESDTDENKCRVCQRYIAHHSEKQLNKCFCDFKNSLTVEVVCEKLGLSEETTKYARDLLTEAKEVSTRTPMSLMAACIFIAGREMNERRPNHKVAGECFCSTQTIAVARREIQDKLNKQEA